MKLLTMTIALIAFGASSFAAKKPELKDLPAESSDQETPMKLPKLMPVV